MVLNWLDDVPMPKDPWFVKVFINFADGAQGLIDLDKFKEILIQWDEHHLKKKMLREKEVAAASRPSSREVKQPAELAEAAEAAAAPPPPPSRRANGDSDIRVAPESRAAFGPSTHGSVPLAREGLAQAAGAPLLSESAAVRQGLSGGSGSLDSEGMETPVRSVRSFSSTARTPSRFQTTGATLRESSDSLGAHMSTGSTGSPGRGVASNIDPEVMFPTYVGHLAIFDDYMFCGDIARGAFGKVMVVRHNATKQLRACKVVAATSALQRELVDMEIRLLKSLNHPNIMKMHEAYYECLKDEQVANGNIYIVTELCEGGDVFSRILHHYQKLGKRMTEEHVAFMMQQILSATHYCHDRGIVHRDIKPENILFVDRTSSSPLKIIDFGLADFTERIREKAKEVKVPKTGALGRLARMLPPMPGGKHLIPMHERKRVMQRAGTAHYMAPEMIEGCYDQKADLFSIGIILCQMLTGWHPFYVQGVDDEQSVRAKISAPEPVDFPAEIWKDGSAEALNLCRQMLEKSPESRCSAAKALAHPWFRDPSKSSAFGNADALSFSIFDGLMRYQAYNKLKRAVLQLLTRELSEFEIQELRAKFMALDTQGDGMLSPEELLDGMRHVGYAMSTEELQSVVAALDGTGNQRIGYKEFISAIIERRVKFDRQQLWECFKKFDMRDTGHICYEDVKDVVCPAITEAEWLEIAGAEVGGNAREFHISFEDFVALMQHGADG